MKNRIISLLLALLLIFSLIACGEYNAPATDDQQREDDTENTGGDNTQGEEEKVGEPFIATVLLDGKAYTPPTVSDSSFAVKVRWTNGKTYKTVELGADGKAECYGLDGEYSVALINLPDKYTHNPNIYVANNDNRSVVIDLLTLDAAVGDGKDVYNCIDLSGPGVYRAKINQDGQEVFYEFEPTKPGTYCIESLMDVSAGMYNPIIDIYAGSFAYKIREKRVDGGGASEGYTTNFKHIVEIDEAFIGNVYTFSVFVEGKDATYPVNVDFTVTYEGGYSYDWIVSDFVYPKLIPNGTNYYSWYSNYVTYLVQDRAKFGDSTFNIASTVIDGKNVFVYTSKNSDGTVKEHFKLNPDDGYYHVYDEEKYAAYDGWGPILYANITIPTEFVDTPLNMIEYAGNKNLTVANGTENYKLFIEGFSELVKSHGDVGPYFCLSTCACYSTNGGACATEDNCKTCAKNGCRTLPRKYIGQRGYADIAIDGRCPVTQELKDFLQKFCISQKYFSDGNGWAEQHVPRYDAYEDSQWLFACGYYTN